MPDYVWDVAALLGYVLLVTGVAFLSLPAALIVAGSLLLVAAVLGQMKSKPTDQRTSGE